MWKILELFDACDPFVRLDKPWSEYSFGHFVDLGVFHKESAIYREFQQIHNVYRALYARSFMEPLEGLEKKQTDNTTNTSSHGDMKIDLHELREDSGDYTGVVLNTNRSANAGSGSGPVSNLSRSNSRNRHHEFNGVGSTAIVAIQV
jgi:hypothetical protein